VSSTPSTSPSGDGHTARIQAGVVSLVVGGTLLAVKFYAYQLTGSAAVLSDALESIVNVVAAAVALVALTVAARPADRNHPYGHGKVEYMTAAFEGGLIAFAALLIIKEALGALARGDTPSQLGAGMALTLGAGLVNAALGWYLIRTGKRHASIALVADGKHVLTDFWTTIGVVVGLALVLATGIWWIDPLVAIVVAMNLAYSGWKVMREATGGLLDEEDPELVADIVGAINESPIPGVIGVHFLRAIRSSRWRHVDAHLVVPEYWSVDRAHDVATELEARVAQELAGDTEILFHVDPCRRAYCRSCDISECPIRVEAFAGRSPIEVEEAVQPETSNEAAAD